MKISLTCTQDGHESKEVVSEFRYLFDALQEHKPIEGGRYLCLVPMGWGWSENPVVAFAAGMEHGSYFGDEFDVVLYEYRGRLEHIQMKLAKEVLRIGMDTEARFAWQEFIESLPTVAYNALHGIGDDTIEFADE